MISNLARIPLRSRWARVTLLVAVFACLAVLGPLLWARYRRQRRRLFFRMRAFAVYALDLPVSSMRYVDLFGDPARTVRGYLDDSANRLYALLTLQFDIQLERLVDSAMRQAKAAVIDPDMPRAVSDLISDTLERIGPEISQAIRRQAGSAILRPLVHRLRLGRSGGAGNANVSALAAPLRSPSVVAATSSPAIGAAVGRAPHVVTPLSPLLLRRTPRTLAGCVFEALVIARVMTLAVQSRVAALVRAARAHVLYTLQPFDRSMWSCFRDPQYWVFTALGATPIPSWLPAAWWLLVFVWQDGSDEYQVAAFIIGLETAKFALTGCWGLILGSARQFVCSTLPLTFPCAVYGPRLSALDALLFFAQIALVWRAFHVLRSLPQQALQARSPPQSQSRGRRHQRSKADIACGAQSPATAGLHRQLRDVHVQSGNLRPPSSHPDSAYRANSSRAHASGGDAYLATALADVASEVIRRRRAALPPSIRALRSPLWLSPIIDRVLALSVVPEASPSPESPMSAGTIRSAQRADATRGARRLFASPALAPVTSVVSQEPVSATLRQREHLRGLCSDIKGLVSPRLHKPDDSGLDDVSLSDAESDAAFLHITCYPEAVQREQPVVFGSSPAGPHGASASVLLQSPTAVPPFSMDSSSPPPPRNGRASHPHVLQPTTYTLEAARSFATRRLAYFQASILEACSAARCCKGLPRRSRRRDSAGGGGGTDSAIGGAAELYHRRGGALQLLYYYNAVVVSACCALAALALFTEAWRALDAACADGSAGVATMNGGRSLWGVLPLERWCSNASAGGPPLPPVLWPALFWLRTLYGLAGAPYVAFKLPLVARLYLTPAATGYDREGRTVPQQIARAAAAASEAQASPSGGTLGGGQTR